MVAPGGCQGKIKFRISDFKSAAYAERGGKQGLSVTPFGMPQDFAKPQESEHLRDSLHQIQDRLPETVPLSNR
jgi:hypothetical protein